MKPVADTRIAPAMSSLSMFFNDSLIVLSSLEIASLLSCIKDKHLILNKKIFFNFF